MFRQLAKLGKKLKQAFKNDTAEEYLNLSYSQYGEDLILNALLPHEAGFYVDVGAHHPYRFSNTSLFYRQGWRGINIDPIPGVKEIFDRERSRDINLELGVSDKETELNYFIFNDQALNSFSEEVAVRLRDHPFYKLLRTEVIQTKPLARILEDHLPGDTSIDFLTVDAEGMDLIVLQSNNWQKFRPKIVVCEVAALKVRDHLGSELHHFMEQHSYELVAKSFNTAFYEDTTLTRG